MARTEPWNQRAQRAGERDVFFRGADGVEHPLPRRQHLERGDVDAARDAGVGDIVRVKGAADPGFVIAQNAGQYINLAGVDAWSGVAGKT